MFLVGVCIGMAFSLKNFEIHAKEGVSIHQSIFEEVPKKDSEIGM